MSYLLFSIEASHAEIYDNVTAVFIRQKPHELLRQTKNFYFHDYLTNLAISVAQQTETLNDTSPDEYHTITYD